MHFLVLTGIQSDYFIRLVFTIKRLISCYNYHYRMIIMVYKGSLIFSFFFDQIQLLVSMNISKVFCLEREYV